jgi:hypothetical protein
MARLDKSFSAPCRFVLEYQSQALERHYEKPEQDPEPAAVKVIGSKVQWFYGTA